MAPKVLKGQKAQPVAGRLSHESRREVIIEQAIKFFAEKGFHAPTRELAQRIGIAQPLLFQHFPSKKALVTAAFDAMFQRMSSLDWPAMLHDDKRDLRSRLINFFSLYAKTLYDHDWIRIYMFAGLEGGAFNRHYIKDLTEPLLREIALQIREHYGYGTARLKDITVEEVELLWILHGGLYYSAIRKQIYKMSVDVDLDLLVAGGVDSMMYGMGQLLSAESRRKGGRNRLKVRGGFGTTKLPVSAKRWDIRE